MDSDARDEHNGACAPPNAESKPQVCPKCKAGMVSVLPVPYGRDRHYFGCGSTCFAGRPASFFQANRCRIAELTAALGAWTTAVDNIEAQYPTDLWPEDGTSLDCTSARAARRTCENVRREAALILEGD